jgi:hypothetical protein
MRSLLFLLVLSCSLPSFAAEVLYPERVSLADDGTQGNAASSRTAIIDTCISNVLLEA